MINQYSVFKLPTIKNTKCHHHLIDWAHKWLLLSLLNQ
jgi:hypothetical protein